MSRDPRTLQLQQERIEDYLKEADELESRARALRARAQIICRTWGIEPSQSLNNSGLDKEPNMP